MESFISAVKALQTTKAKVSIGKVKTINGNSCTVIRDELPELLDVRLQSIISDTENCFLIVPKIDSEVVVAEIENAPGETTIINHSEIEKFQCKVDGALLELKAGKLSIKNDHSDLKDILKQLFDQLNSAIITAPGGAGFFSTPDKAKFIFLKQKTLNLLD